MNHADDERALRELCETLRLAEMNGDVTTMVESLAEDAVIMAPWMQPIEGRAACTEFIARELPSLHERFARQIRISLPELRVIGDWAYTRGVMEQTVTPRDGGPAGYDCYNVLFMFTRGSDGNWLQSRIIFNIIEESEGEAEETA